MGVEDQDLEKTRLGEEKRQGEARSHPHCCPELKMCCTRKSSTVKRVSAKAPLLQMSPENTCNSKESWFPEQTPCPTNTWPKTSWHDSQWKVLAAETNWQHYSAKCELGLSQANLPSTLPPTQDPTVGCSEGGGGGQLATSQSHLLSLLPCSLTG